LAGARHPKAAKAFVEFLLGDGGQRVFPAHGLFPVTPLKRVEGPAGSVAEKVVEFVGGGRSYFGGEAGDVCEEGIAQKRYREVNERYQREIEAAWTELKKRP